MKGARGRPALTAGRTASTNVEQDRVQHAVSLGINCILHFKFQLKTT